MDPNQKKRQHSSLDIFLFIELILGNDCFLVHVCVYTVCLAPQQLAAAAIAVVSSLVASFFYFTFPSIRCSHKVECNSNSAPRRLLEKFKLQLDPLGFRLYSLMLGIKKNSESLEL